MRKSSEIQVEGWSSLPNDLGRNSARLREGVTLLSKAIRNLTVLPHRTIILEKTPAAGAVIEPSEDGRSLRSRIYVSASYAETTGLPKPSPASNIEFRIEDPKPGLNGKNEMALVANGPAEQVNNYRSRFDIDSRYITLEDTAPKTTNTAQSEQTLQPVIV